MKKSIIWIVLCLVYHGAWAQKIIYIKNTMDHERLEIISIPYTTFSKHFAVDSTFTISDKSGKKYVHQLEKLGTKHIQNVLVQVPIAANGALELWISKERAPHVTPKTYARVVPERYDDFAWENDVVAFRLYGKSLEGRPDDAQGMDYWAKRTTDLVINKWYKGDDYHVDHGEGLDYYAVGQTLGAGDIAPYFQNKIHFTKHYRQHEILDNGPLRTTFRLTHEPEILGGQNVSLTKTVSLDAGKQFNKIVIQLENKDTKKTPIVIGLAKRHEDHPKYSFDATRGYLAYWEPAIKDFGETGTAIIVPDTEIEFLENDTKQFLLKTTITNKKPLVYYNGGAWNRAGKITHADQWHAYVKSYTETLQKPLHVQLK